MLQAVWNRIMGQIVRPVRWYLDQMVQQFFAHNCISQAGALTYTTLFAVVPMMTVAYAMFSVLPEFESVGERIQGYIFENFVPDSSALVQEKLVEFSERARKLTAVGFVVLFVTAFLMLVTIEKTFNTIWHVSEPRRGLQRFLLYWGVLSLGPPSIAGGMFISLYLISLPLVSDFDTFGISNVLLGYMPVTLTTAGFTVLYYAVPNCQVLFRHALAGGLFTMGAFEVAKKLFGLVVSNSSIEPIYGTFAAVPLFLTWLYLVWVLILSGAIFVRTLSMKQEDEGEHPEPLLVKCSRILQLLYDAHMDGRSISDIEITQEVHLNGTEHEKVFNALQELKVLNQTEDERWLLGRNLKALTLWDLYQQLPEGLDHRRLELVKDMDNVVEPLKSLAQFGSNQMSVSLEAVFGGAH
jgi:membrane protein